MSISRRNFLRGAGKSVGASLALTIVPELTADTAVDEPKTEARTLLHWRDCNMAGYEWTQAYHIECTSGVFRLVAEQEVIGDGDYRLLRERTDLLTGQQICEALADLIQEDNPGDDAFDQYIVAEAAVQVAWFGKKLAREFLMGYAERLIGAPFDHDELVEEGYDEIVALLANYS